MYLNSSFSGNNIIAKISGEKHLDRSPHTNEVDIVRIVKIRKNIPNCRSNQKIGEFMLGSQIRKGSIISNV